MHCSARDAVISVRTFDVQHRVDADVLLVAGVVVLEELVAAAELGADDVYWLLPFHFSSRTALFESFAPISRHVRMFQVAPTTSSMTGQPA
jgi:hypothetical protein